jgi:hypothetical protein
MKRWSLDARNGDHTSRLAECLMRHVLNPAYVRVPIMVPDTFSDSWERNFSLK